MANWSTKASDAWGTFGRDKTNWKDNAERDDMRSRIISLAAQRSGKRSETLKGQYSTFVVDLDGQDVVNIKQTWKSSVWLGKDD